MKYLFRFLGAFLIWPIMLLFMFLIWVVSNFFIILFHLNLKHCWEFKKEDLYFYLESDGKEPEIDLVTYRTNWLSYKIYYASPLKMLTNTVTKIYT